MNILQGILLQLDLSWQQVRNNSMIVSRGLVNMKYHMQSLKTIS